MKKKHFHYSDKDDNTSNGTSEGTSHKPQKYNAKKKGTKVQHRNRSPISSHGNFSPAVQIRNPRSNDTSYGTLSIEYTPDVQIRNPRSNDTSYGTLSIEYTPDV
jgi:hypothetical protein